MKFKLFSLFFLVIIGHINAQCPTSNVILQTQTDVDNFIIQYPNCTTMPHSISVRGSGITNLNGLSNLTHIEESLKIGEYTGGNSIGTSITNMQGLNALTTVGYSLNILYNDALISLSGLEALTSVGSSLQINLNDLLPNFTGLNNLVSVGNSFLLGSNNSLADCSGLESLTTIGGDLKITYNDLLINLDGLNNISDFSGDFEIRENPVLESILQFNGVTTIGQTSIWFNESLSDISGLASVETFTNHFELRQNPNLSDLTGIQNVILAEGNIIIQEMDEITDINMNSLDSILGILSVQSNPLLEDISFNSLTNALNINIDHNDILTHVDGFSSVTELTINPPFGTQINISYNPSLIDISGISNIDLTNLQWLYIRGNSQLSLCNLLNVCQYLSDGGNHSINSNGVACESLEDFITQCEASFNIITGTATYDNNNNGCDASDLNVSTSTISVSSTNGVDTTTTYLNAEGIYSLFVEEGPYTTTLIPSVNNNLYTLDPTVHNSNFTGSGNTNTHDFCISPSSNVSDLQIVVIPEEDARPGFDIVYHIIVENVGTNTENGTITFEFDDEKQAFVSASQNPVNQTTTEVTFNYSNLQALQTLDITVIMNTLPPPIVESEDELLLVATLTTNDINVSNNTYNLTQIVVNSFDPNDKQVLQGDTLLLEYTGNYLEYRIRYQNTGTASAINVRVTDALSDKLDWSTFQPILASYDYRVQINEAHFIEFIFDNINLPAEQDDLEGSQGFITFRIKPKNDVVVGDIITGQAKIYFDYNAPIITNTVNTEIINTLSVNEFDSISTVIYPNPVDDVVYLESNSAIKKVEVYNSIGQQILTKKNTSVIDLSNIHSGIYFIKIVNSNGNYQVQKMIKK